MIGQKLFRFEVGRRSSPNGHAPLAQFETLLEQIRAEHEARVENLRAEFDAVTKLLELEHRRLGNPPQAPMSTATQTSSQAIHQTVHQPAAHQLPEGGQEPGHQPAPLPQQPLADFLVSKLNEV